MTEQTPDDHGIKPIKKLIITSPYEEPSEHWKFNHYLNKYEKRQGRRPAGYTKATKGSKTGSNAALFEEIPHINRIREKVSAWRLQDYAGSTHITRQLLKRWHDTSLRRPDNRFFYCQLEAIETIIWAHEIGSNDALIRNLGGDGGLFRRLCCKMATGTGKTVVMAMLVVWQVLNDLADRDGSFTRNILVIAPSISVKRRLAVLKPNEPHNYYEKFAIVDKSGLEKLNRARIQIHNWHVLMNAAEQKKPKSSGQASRVMRSIPISDSVFSSNVLDHASRNILVINDEAHHAWRPMNNDETMRREMKEEKERATRWMEGLDKIHKDRHITTCYDFSATPFRPTGHSVSEVERFKWIISDFSLEDAIESGLVKTPRTPKDDDSGQYSEHGMSVFHHIFPEVQDDFKTNRNEREPLPQLVSDAYEILGASWKETRKKWKDDGYNIPPVMITVCNNTKSASRIVNHFESNVGQFGDLVSGMEKIDSVAIDNEYEDGDSSDLRTKIDTVGKVGEPGQDVTHVISVNMLTEGWDAHNVTHIMGLRAFESQLLCEQVVGRGLRRNSYDVDAATGLLLPEYVNVFGIPFSFMPHEGSEDGKANGQPITPVYPVDSKESCKIGWPKGSVKMELRDRLVLDWKKIPSMEVDGRGTITKVMVAPSLSGRHIGGETELKVDGSRLQEFVFRMSSHVYVDLELGTPDPYKLASLIRAVEGYINHGSIKATGVSITEKERYIRALKSNMNDIIKHVANHIKHEETENKYFKPDDPAHPVMSTGTMPKWYSRRKCLQEDDVLKCHLNVGVYDTDPEKKAMQELERNSKIAAWVKNDQHLGFKVPYYFEGSWHDYYPDFLARLENGITVVIEIKGAEEEEARLKQEALDEWIQVVNEDNRYGTWINCGLIRNNAGLKDAIEQAHTGHKASVTSVYTQSSTCPACGKRASGRIEINSIFGFRNINGIIRVQSWCKKCRTSQA